MKKIQVKSILKGSDDGVRSTWCVWLLLHLTTKTNQVSKTLCSFKVTDNGQFPEIQ